MYIKKFRYVRFCYHFFLNLVVSTNEEEENKKPIESNGLTICHSRNSSDSSGYHEASILSEQAASLGRNRPKSAFVGDLPSNLTEMAGQSRSTTSLIAGKCYSNRRKNISNEQNVKIWPQFESIHKAQVLTLRT